MRGSVLEAGAGHFSQTRAETFDAFTHREILRMSKGLLCPTLAVLTILTAAGQMRPDGEQLTMPESVPHLERAAKTIHSARAILMIVQETLSRE